MQQMSWGDYPLGTKVYAVNGGCWERVARGWKWCTGATFPAPGGDATRVEIPPGCAWVSIAIWPENSGVEDVYGNSQSTDNHRTREEAEAVCKLLERDGLGGDGIIYPTETFVKCGFLRL